jgi:GT2 family glycosyltransferase
MKNPKVSILICHLNGEQIIQNCLSSLIATSYPNFDIHLILNGTTDNSEKIIRKFFWRDQFDKKHKVKIYKSDKNLGYTGGFNYLLKEVMKDRELKYIASINNDTEVEPSWLSELVKFAEENKADICQPKIKSLMDKNKFEYAGASGGFMDKYGYPFCRGRIFNTLEEDRGQYDSPVRIFWTCGSCALFRKDLFKKIGFLDEDFFLYVEETDFCWRANLAGAKIYCVPSSVIYHLGSYSVKKEKMDAKKQYLLHRNTMIMFFKNYSNESIKKLKYKRIFLELISGLVFPKQKGLAVLKALVWIVRNREIIEKKHEETQKLRKVSDEEIRRLMIKSSIAYLYFVKKKQKFDELEGYFGGKNA